MRFIYKRSTFLICMMIAFIAVLFLYLYTDLKVWDVQAEIAEYVRINLLIAEQEEPSEENLRSAVDRIGEELHEEISFNYIKADNSSKNNDYNRENDNESAEGSSEETNKKEYVQPPAAEYQFVFDEITSSMKIERTLSDGARYDAEIVYSPMRIVLKRYFGAYILVVAVLFLLELGIVKLQSVTRNDRFGNMMLSTLITGFSHELKTPLAVVKVLVENWDYIDEKDRPAYSRQMTKEVEHFDRLAGKLREINELNSDKLHLRKRKVDLPEMVREACEHQKVFIEDKNLNVIFNVDHPEKCMITADPEFIRIAVENFVSNAVKYSEKEIRIEIRAEKKVLFRISNDGKFLSKKETKKVWNLFYKMDPSRTDRFESSGVGLAVTKSILEAHRARFGCISKPSDTTFWFEI
ncbi:MAG: HAMP domain-containing histidine kinase [Lachnospiraceae bacterium]|nr:HAMP domain-containing histidine kinase [Lachnospiraceae bacterium]